MASPEYEAAIEICEALGTLSHRLNAQLDVANAYLETLPSTRELAAALIFATLIHRMTVYPLERSKYNAEGVRQLAEIAWLMTDQLDEAGMRLGKQMLEANQGHG